MTGGGTGELVPYGSMTCAAWFEHCTNKKVPQATRSCDHHTYRCYRRGPDGIRELSPCGPGALQKLPEATGVVNAPTRPCPCPVA